MRTFSIFTIGLLSILLPSPTKALDATEDSDPAKMQSAAAEKNDNKEGLPTSGTSTVDASDKTEASTQDSKPPDESGEKKKKKKKRKKLELNARIHTVWKMRHSDTPDNPLTKADEFEKKDIESDFSIRRARIKISWKPKKWLTAVLKVGGLQEHEYGLSLLQDAYIHISPSQFVEIRVGQFKKPFSRLELRSSGKLKVYNRGEGNSLFIEDLHYGGRDLGIQLSGRIVPAVKLDYEIGVFNGNGPDISEQGNSKDIAARVKMSPLSWMDFGVNGSFKFFNKTENEDKFAWATSADISFKAAGFRAYAEGIIGLDHDFLNRDAVVTENAPAAFSIVGIFSYKRAVSSGPFGIALEPIFKIEILDPNMKEKEDHVIVYNPGFNSYIGKYLRLMIHGEIRRPTLNSKVRYPSREFLAIQFCFDI